MYAWGNDTVSPFHRWTRPRVVTAWETLTMKSVSVRRTSVPSTRVVSGPTPRATSAGKAPGQPDRRQDKGRPAARNAKRGRLEPRGAEGPGDRCRRSHDWQVRP